MKKIVLFILSFLLITSSAFAASVPFSFTINSPVDTSAGVYTSNTSSGVLVRTLWSNITYPAGTYNKNWDGTDDQGRLVANGNYYIRILTNNVTYTWQGVIGNSSDQMSGVTVHHGLETIYGMSFTGANGYYANNYAEQHSTTNKISISDPQSVTHLLSDVQGADTIFTTTDGNYVYWDAQDANNKSNVFVYATNVSNDAEVIFSAGAAVATTYGRTYASGIDRQNNSNATVTGLAVQQSGNYLFVAHAGTNDLDVLNKTTGALVQSIAVTAPAGLATDNNGNLWMISNGTTVSKYTINPNGTLSLAALTLSGLVAPMAIAVSPDNTTVLVADGSSSQQVKAYNNATGALLWTFGQAGGYAHGPTVPNSIIDWSSNPKFYFSDFDAVHTFVAFAPDGSFWVGDPGNDRVLHFSSGQSYIEQIMYLHRFYSSAVDPNNPSRVFADYLEFNVDYSRTIGPGNGSWTLVNNWGYNVTSRYDNLFQRLATLTTLNNGHTYAFLFDGTTDKFMLVELVPGSGVRFTGNEPLGAFQFPSIYPDGSLRWLAGALGSPLTWHQCPLTGFDTSNNPVWGTAVAVAATPTTTLLDPIPASISLSTQPMTSSGIVIAFDEGLPNNGNGQHSGYHLGGVRAGDNKWLWRTAISTNSAYQGAFPADGAYDIGNGVQYGGSKALALGRSIIWGYHGEFWKQGETNEWNQVYDDGLMVGQFGTTSLENWYSPNAPPMFAGNAMAGSLVTGTDGNVYLYHNDESTHGAIHRWLISGLNTIAEQNIPVTLSNTAGGLLGQYYDGRDLNNFNLKIARVDASINLNSNPTGTNLTNPNNYSARWTGFVAPVYSETYTFTVNANSGVRLWVDNALLIDQWNNASSAQYTATMALTSGTIYPIRVEYYNAATSSVTLSWSSNSQVQEIIPSGNFFPATPSDISTGTNLMEGLQFNRTLVNNMYGWSRSPSTDDPINKIENMWDVTTGSMTSNAIKPQDVFADFSETTGPYTVTRDLGTNSSLTSWTISGTFSFSYYLNSNSSANTGPDYNDEGAYLDVLDGAGKVIARFYGAGSWQATSLLTVYANTSVVEQDQRGNILWQTLLQPQPLSISASNGKLTFAYGPYAPITTTIFDPTSNWKNPKTLRMYFFGPQEGLNNDPAMDLQNMSFLAAPSGSIPNTTVFGDVNGDGNVNVADVALTAQYAMGLPVMNFNAAAAQVSTSGRVDMYDAYLIAAYAIGSTANCPKCGTAIN